MSTKDKIIAACVIAIVAVGFIAIFTGNDTATVSITSEPSNACSTESKQFTDDSGQVWSASNIEYSNVPCETAVEIAESLAQQNVGLEPTNPVPPGWNCTDECRHGNQTISFDLHYIEGG